MRPVPAASVTFDTVKGSPTYAFAELMDWFIVPDSSIPGTTGELCADEASGAAHIAAASRIEDNTFMDVSFPATTLRSAVGRTERRTGKLRGRRLAGDVGDALRLHAEVRDRDDFVALGEALQAHAFRRAAGAANLADRDADHLIAARDHQQLVARRDEDLIDDVADLFLLRERLHAFAAARGVAIVLDRRALPVRLRGDDQHFAAVVLDDVHRHDLVAGREGDRLHAARRAPHRADVALAEVHGHPVVRREKDIAVAGAEID